MKQVVVFNNNLSIQFDQLRRATRGGIVRAISTMGAHNLPNDFVEETEAEVWKNLSKKFSTPVALQGELSSYIFAASRNLALTRLGRFATQRKVELCDAHRAQPRVLEVVSQSTSPSDAVLVRYERETVLRRALKRLRQKDIMALNKKLERTASLAEQTPADHLQAARIRQTESRAKRRLVAAVECEH